MPDCVLGLMGIITGEPIVDGCPGDIGRSPSAVDGN
jgi:hypothetical protein